MERTIEVGEGDDTLHEKLSVGDVLELVLEGNPTTGYQWQVKALDMDVLDWAEGPTYTPSQPQRIGSGGTYRFRFKAIKRGKALLRLEYRRPWEEGASAARTLTCKATVR